MNEPMYDLSDYPDNPDDAPHDSATCEFCQVEAVMKQIMALVEALPEWGVPLFDDAVTAVYEAADDAQSVLRCWAVDRDNQA